MNMFELNTLFYVSISLMLVMSLLNFITWRANRSTPGTFLYFIYPIITLLSFSTFLLQSESRNWVYIGIGNSLLFSASIVHSYALCKFFDFKHFSFKVYFVITICLALSLWWSLYIDSNLKSRITIYNLQRIIEGIFLFYLFFKVAVKQYPNASIIYLLHFSILIIAFSSRSFWIYDAQLSTILVDAWLEASVFITGILTPMFYATGIAVLCNERRSLHLKKLTLKAQKDAELTSLFLSTMSHEIRTPLNGILGSAQLVMNQSSDPRDKPYCEAIINSAESLNLLIDKVLDYASQDQSTDALYEEDIELIPWLNNLCLLLSPLAEQKKLTLVLNIDLPEQSCYYCDQQKIRQILINLVGNAIKFTDKGSVNIHITQLSNSTLEHTIRFSVKDTGPGIENDEIQHLTEPYVQSTAGKIKGGTGLGLAISSRMLAKLGSKLNITSTLNQGSCFSFDLKMCLGELSLVEQRHQSTEYLTDLDILLVEDLPLNQKIALEFMAMDEHKVKIADNGQSALELMQKYQFDLVLLDMNLPDFNGQEVIKRLKHIDHKNPRTPIVAFTASLSPDEVKEYVSLGIKDIVGKPIKLEKLRQTILNAKKSQTSSANSELEAILYDISAIDALTHSFSEDELSSIYNEFVLSARNKLIRCKELLVNEQDQCIKILHRQASTALQLGFNLYGMELKKLERKLLDKKSINDEIDTALVLWQKSLNEYLQDVRSKI